MSKGIGRAVPVAAAMYVTVPAAPDPNGNRAERRAAKPPRPTRARISLLMDIANGLVRRIGTTDYRSGIPAPARVTRPVAELVGAGWATRGVDGIYALTDAGQDVIADTVR